VSHLVATRWQCELENALGGHFGFTEINVRVTATEDNALAIARYIRYPSGICNDRARLVMPL